MSDLNQQPGLFDDLDDAPIDEPVLTTAQPTMQGSESIKVVPLLTYLTDEHRVRVVDVKLAELLSGTNAQQGYDDLFYIILMLCLSQQSQHSCLTLTEVDWTNPFNLRQSDFTKLEGTQPDTLSPFSNDFTTEAAIRYLLSHHSVGEQKPLQLFNQRLYFSRLAGYEQTLAQRLLTMSERQLNLDDAVLAQLLTRYFPDDPSIDIDWQKVACAIAATKGFSVITGGPGTGKTTTVTKLLAILQSLYKAAPLSIKLVAPTGKAAARLTESILGAKNKLSEIPADINALIPQSAQTIHRLLGVKPFTNKFRHDKSNPLHVDVLIIDEASMVDLSLMAKLIEALPDHARLILLGDKDQLASVDTGSVMSDLCQGLVLGQTPRYSKVRCEQLNTLCFNGAVKLNAQSQSEFKLADCIAFLQHSYRFDAKSGIGQLALAVNTNNRGILNYVEQQSSEGHFSDIILDYDFVSTPIEKLVNSAASHYANYLTLIAQGASVAKVHAAFASYQLLAAVREGDYGVNSLNQRIERVLQQQGLISVNPNQRHYIGMPIMVSQNDYQLKLFNGDIGILMPDDSGQLKALFIDEQGNERAFSPARLPVHDKVYVMTIHKSQGSEFSYTAMVLPPLKQASIGINRQLVYTGITRAKQTFELVADKKVLQLAMGKSVSRASGLYERLV
ncbi:exodeoxyribonuclease V subunit alpha [Pseudoalteromonas sp. Scap03]|uniref:exodeoxyribonuclease V subunit alpha n=1 Tax=unclassified Pseudoalteromonas TaxID=194690 RepID=UPI0015BE2F54|nr:MULTISPECIES: exodeoxyribonuclease V subunit alpha [unclassified Pseudoalteromonas]MDN3485680.1 exodeoxyribonuclease V subunit alpha [Pseudoalteromonas sp. APC 3224]NWL15991.1 exodeoxyribonuclease V subunit alpha [Pseudoalteromonas sp. Scap03]QLE81125.1 exodeoxyribonuclease V subunit alpha [Pseudoalteromonas sp. Scap25]QLE89068.1 exodeoxyribonuclease V subunit alpha [Pseudoalteromonas sp. Scap06]